MNRRGQLLTVSTAAVVSIASVTAASVQTHAARWWLHRDDLAHRARLDPDALTGFPPSGAPRVLESVALSVGSAVPFVAVVLLGTALALVGRRWWAVGAVVGLNLAWVADRLPLTGGVLLPADPTSLTLPPGWPWTEIVLDVALALLPVLVAAPARESAPVGATRPVLRRAGAAAFVVLLVGVVLAPVDLGAGSVLHAGLVVLVVLSAGLVAVGSSRRQLVCGAVVLVVLALARASYGGYGSPVAGVLTVLAGPVAVLAAPWAARAWTRVFRSGASVTAA